MISAAKPPLSPTCSTGPHERSEPAHHLRASLVNIVATEPQSVQAQLSLRSGRLLDGQGILVKTSLGVTKASDLDDRRSKRHDRGTERDRHALSYRQPGARYRSRDKAGGHCHFPALDRLSPTVAGSSGESTTRRTPFESDKCGGIPMASLITAAAQARRLTPSSACSRSATGPARAW